MGAKGQIWQNLASQILPKGRQVLNCLKDSYAPDASLASLGQDLAEGLLNNPDYLAALHPGSAQRTPGA